MKKYVSNLLLISFAALALLAHGYPGCDIAQAHDGYATATITVATDNTLSDAVAVPRSVEWVGIYVPTITSATISLKGSWDGGTTWDDVFCLNNGTNTVLWSSAAGTGGMILESPCRVSFYSHIKVFSGAGQASNRVFKLIWRKDAVKSNQ